MAEDRIAALEAENERLRDRVCQLEEALSGGDGFLTPIEWGLTGKEVRVLGVLMHRDIATKEQVMAGLYDPGSDDEPMIKIVDVFVCKLRKKIAPYGITIDTRWGEGYLLSSDMKTLVRAQMSLGSASGFAA